MAITVNAAGGWSGRVSGTHGRRRSLFAMLLSIVARLLLVEFSNSHSVF
jgi:hypothetical protein